MYIPTGNELIARNRQWIIISNGISADVIFYYINGICMHITADVSLRLHVLDNANIEIN